MRAGIPEKDPGFANWNAAYLTVLELSTNYSETCWGLVYLDQDDIPELI